MVAGLLSFSLLAVGVIWILIYKEEGVGKDKDRQASDKKLQDDKYGQKDHKAAMEALKRASDKSKK